MIAALSKSPSVRKRGAQCGIVCSKIVLESCVSVSQKVAKPHTICSSKAATTTCASLTDFTGSLNAFPPHKYHINKSLKQMLAAMDC